MSTHHVDARGCLCPKPIIMTKAALDAASLGDTLIVLIDKEESKTNTVTFLKDNNIPVTWELSEGVFTLQVHKPDHEITATVSEESCPIANGLQ